VANAAVPAVVAVNKVAAKLEAKSGDLVARIAGSKVKAKVAGAKRAVKKTVRKAAPRVRKAAAAVEATVAV